MSEYLLPEKVSLSKRLGIFTAVGANHALCTDI
jgi:hypothetical protein